MIYFTIHLQTTTQISQRPVEACSLDNGLHLDPPRHYRFALQTTANIYHEESKRKKEDESEKKTRKIIIGR